LTANAGRAWPASPRSFAIDRRCPPKHHLRCSPCPANWPIARRQSSRCDARSPFADQAMTAIYRDMVLVAECRNRKIDLWAPLSFDLALVYLNVRRASRSFWRSSRARLVSRLSRARRHGTGNTSRICADRRPARARRERCGFRPPAVAPARRFEIAVTTFQCPFRLRSPRQYRRSHSFARRLPRRHPPPCLASPPGRSHQRMAIRGLRCL
jgi:hypothetical protein